MLSSHPNINNMILGSIPTWAFGMLQIMCNCLSNLGNFLAVSFFSCDGGAFDVQPYLVAKRGEPLRNSSIYSTCMRLILRVGRWEQPIIIGVI